jgi:hypothetical protein
LMDDMKSMGYSIKDSFLTSWTQPGVRDQCM